MKKFTSLLLALLMLLSSLTLMTVSAGASAGTEDTFYTAATTSANLNYEIQYLPSGGTLNVYTGEVVFTEYLYINKPCTINFHGYFNDSLLLQNDGCESYMIYVGAYAEPVTLNFYNCEIRSQNRAGETVCESRGSVIYVNNDECTINGNGTTRFVQCTTEADYGGAIYINDGCSNCHISGCFFDHCNVADPGNTGEGACIYSAADGCVIEDCYFDISKWNTMPYAHCVFGEEKNGTIIKHCDPEKYQGEGMPYEYDRYSERCLIRDYTPEEKDEIDIEKCFAGIPEGDYLIVSMTDTNYCLDIDCGIHKDHQYDTSNLCSGDNVYLRDKNNCYNRDHPFYNYEANVFHIAPNVNEDELRAAIDALGINPDEQDIVPLADSIKEYTITTKEHGFSLTVGGEIYKDGANIHQSEDMYPVNGKERKSVWYFIPAEGAGEGVYYLRAKYGKYMDVSGIVNGVKPYEGVNVQSWSFTGAPNQQFMLIPVNESGFAIGSTLSQGNIWIIAVVAVVAVGGVAVLVIVKKKKKKKPVLACDTENKEE